MTFEYARFYLAFRHCAYIFIAKQTPSKVFFNTLMWGFNPIAEFQKKMIKSFKNGYEEIQSRKLLSGKNAAIHMCLK